MDGILIGPKIDISTKEREGLQGEGKNLEHEPTDGGWVGGVIPGS